MAKIPNYTRGLVLERATPNQVNLGQIEAAGAGMQGAAQVLDVGVQVAQKIKQTNDLTATNSGVIKKKRKDLEDINTFEKENRDNPIGYAKRQEEWLKERDKSYLESLPSDEARQSAQREFDLINLAHFKSAQTTETELAAIKFVNEAEETAEDLAIMARRGVPLEELRTNRQATIMSLGNTLSPDELMKMDAQIEALYTKSHFDGLIDVDPIEAKRKLDSKEFDNILGLANIESLDNRINRTLESLEKSRTQNPYEYLAKTGRPATPIEFDSVESFANSIEQRTALRTTVSGEVPNMPLLAKPEIEALENMLVKGDAQTRINTLATLDDGLGEADFAEISSQLFGGKNPHIGVAIAVSSEAPDVANDILNGIDRINSKTMNMPSDTDLRDKYNEALGQTVFDPQTNEQFFSAVKAHYAESAFRGGITNGELNEKIVNKSITDVLGGVINTNSFFGRESKILSFRNEKGQPLDKDVFDELYESVTNEELRNLGMSEPLTIGGEAIDMDVIFSNAILKTVGDGKYTPVMPDDTVPLDKDGNNFVIDMKAIQRSRLE